jgi:hypothetical protein
MNKNMLAIINYLERMVNETKYEMDLAERMGDYGVINPRFIEYKAKWSAYMDALNIVKKKAR